MPHEDASFMLLFFIKPQNVSRKLHRLANSWVTGCVSLIFIFVLEHYFNFSSEALTNLGDSLFMFLSGSNNFLNTLIVFRQLSYNILHQASRCRILLHFLSIFWTIVITVIRWHMVAVLAFAHQWQTIRSIHLFVLFFLPRRFIE